MVISLASRAKGATMRTAATVSVTSTEIVAIVGGINVMS
jgi:hypothetical protein